MIYGCKRIPTLGDFILTKHFINKFSMLKKLFLSITIKLDNNR